MLNRVSSSTSIAQHTPISIDGSGSNGWNSVLSCVNVVPTTVSQCVGITVAPITANIVNVNRIITLGTLFHANTGSFQVGDLLYGASALTNDPNLGNGQVIGVVKTQHATNGKILITLGNNSRDVGVSAKSKYKETVAASKSIITLPSTPYPGSTDVYFWGNKQVPKIDTADSIYDYEESGNDLEFSFPIPNNTRVYIEYTELS